MVTDHLHLTFAPMLHSLFLAKDDLTTPHRWTLLVCGNAALASFTVVYKELATRHN